MQRCSGAAVRQPAARARTRQRLHGRFIYDSNARSLTWDDDGLAATANLLVATFDTKVTLTIDSFLLV